MNQMLFSFWLNEPAQLEERGSKTTLAVAMQGLGEGKTELGLNIQTELAKAEFSLDQRFQAIRENFVDAFYVRVVMHDGTAPRHF